MGPIYWVLAFIVAAAVPNLQGLVGIIGALFALNFTYSFPVLAYLGYRVTDDAKLEGEGFDPYTGVTTRHDSGFKRYARGYMKGALVNIPVTIFIFAALACSGMGACKSFLLVLIFKITGTDIFVRGRCRNLNRHLRPQGNHCHALWLWPANLIAAY